MDSIFVYASLIILLSAAFFGLGLIKWLLSLRRVVPTNMVHIVQSKKSTISYGKDRSAGNVYYNWPSWIPIIGVTVSAFPESVFDVSLDSYEAYDAGRLPFVVDITAFFRVSDSNISAQRVSTFEELKSQLKSILQGAVRRVLAKDKLESIMEDRAGLGARFTNEVEEQLKEWGVKTVKLIEFMDIRDGKGSQVIDNIMAKEKSRIEMESRMQVAENHQHAETKEIETRRQVELQRQEAEQQLGVRTAEKEKTVGIANEAAKQDVLAANRITMEKNMEVQRVQQVKSAEIAKDVAVVAAEQDKEVRITQSDADKQTTVIIAEGNLQAAMRNAEGIKLEGDARASAEQAMLMAPVNTQITLAKEIGENEGYQQYLVTIRQVEAGQTVGVEMAKAFSNADLKVIANSGDIGSGINKLGQMVSSSGGTNMAAMLEALSQSSTGSALVNSLVNKISGESSK